MSSKHILSFNYSRKCNRLYKLVTKHTKNRSIKTALSIALLLVYCFPNSTSAQTLNTWGSFYSSNASTGSTAPTILSSSCWKTVSAGDRFALAIRADGSLWGWGDNSKYALGIGADSTLKNTPVQIGNENTWAIVDVSSLGSSYAIKKDGTLWTWGDNRAGQLGYNTNGLPQQTPRQVGISTEWKDVKAADLSALGMKKNGIIFTCGSSAFGQLGDGTDSDRSQFKQVGTATNWSAIAAGSEHYFAIKTDGSLWGWGLNASGQLGDGTNENRNTPIRIGSASNWAFATSRFASSFFVDKEGGLWGTGDNSYGQLGDGTEVSKNVISRVSTTSDWAAVAPGDFHTLAVKKDGSFWSWGWNFKGQLGDGSVTAKLSPVRINMTGKIVLVESGGTAAFCLIQTAPDVPTGLAAIRGNAFNTLTWNANTESNLSGYKIYGGTVAGSSALLATVPAGTTSYTHNNLANETTYYYRISAVTATEESSLTAEVQCTPKDIQPTITMNTLAAKQYGDSDFEIGAKTNISGLEKIISYSSSNPDVAIVKDGKVRIIGTGSTKISAGFDQSSTFAGISASQELVVERARQSIIIEKIPTLHVKGKNHQMTLTSSSGLPVEVKSLSPFIVKAEGNVLVPESNGTATVTITQGGDANYLPAEVTINVVVAASEQEINVHQIVSPNGDGINDVLSLQGLAAFPEYQLTVVNRNGTKVFDYYESKVSATGSEPSYSGTAVEHKLPELPNGTYFYTLKFKDNNVWKHQSGYFIVKY